MSVRIHAVHLQAMCSLRSGFGATVKSLIQRAAGLLRLSQSNCTLVNNFSSRKHCACSFKKKGSKRFRISQIFPKDFPTCVNLIRDS